MSDVIRAGDIVINKEIFVNLGDDSSACYISKNTRLLVLTIEKHEQTQAYYRLKLLDDTGTCVTYSGNFVSLIFKKL